MLSNAHAHAQLASVRCQSIFISETNSSALAMVDESGFIDLFARPVRGQDTAPSVWVSLEALQKMAGQGRKKVRFQEWPEAVLEKLWNLQRLDPAQLESLTVAHQLQILSTFGQWNLLLPETLSLPLQARMQRSLEQWQGRDFLQWALFRKISPQTFSAELLQPLQAKIRQDFANWDITTQLEVLGAELLHGGGWNFRDTQFLLQKTAEALSQHPGTLNLKPIKELYRALVFWRAHQTTFFYREILSVENQLEIHLNRQGLSLQEGGRSGSKNPTGDLDPWFQRLIDRIDQLFPYQEKQMEFTDPSLWGFFDPVDLYYPQLRLVVEWDGPSHYYRTFNGDGTLNRQSQILRPLDQVKDRNLNRLGISILRWSKQKNSELDTADIEALILDQNPQTWVSPGSEF